jgi:hypothetical protein
MLYCNGCDMDGKQKTGKLCNACDMDCSAMYGQKTGDMDGHRYCIVMHFGLI